MNLRWSFQAAQDLSEIYTYIAQDNREAARRTVAAIFERAECLTRSPRQGRPGTRPHTRELVLTPLPYIVVYRVRDESIEIVRVWHGAQNR